MELPDHLKGLFRQFENHAPVLREIHGPTKRSIKFDDVTESLCMDIKLQSTGWHRLTKDMMNEISRRQPRRAPLTSEGGTSGAREEDHTLGWGHGKRRILSGS